MPKLLSHSSFARPGSGLAAASQGAGAPAIKRANLIKFVSGNGPGTSQLQPRHWEEGRAAASGDRVFITRPHAAPFPNSPAAAGFLFDTDALRLSEPKYKGLAPWIVGRKYQ